MKRIYFALVALIVTLSINAQVVKVYDTQSINPTTPVAAFTNSENHKYKVSFEEAQAGPIEIFNEHNADIAGLWHFGEYNLYLTADGTIPKQMFTNYKFDYFPGKGNKEGLLVFYDADKDTVEAVNVVKKLTADTLVLSNVALNQTSTFTRSTPITSLSVSPTEITAYVGETLQIDLTITPDDGITRNFVKWVTLNPYVATVSDTGLVTMLGPGNTVISCQSTDGTFLSAGCNVCVRQAVESITLNKNAILLSKNGTYNLTATISPANASNKAVAWSSSAPAFISVSNDGTVTANGYAAADAIITCTAQDGSGVLASCKVYTQSDEHECVDLGLPSGTMWATANIGAATPKKKGDLFAWGESTINETSSWTNYKYANGDENHLTKYCTDSSYGDNGFVDNKTELETIDDAATVLWGNAWCMPTEEQWRELLENCNIVQVSTDENENGFIYRFTSKINGNIIIIPSEKKRRVGGIFYYDYNVCYFWTKELDNTPSLAKYIYIQSYDKQYVESWPRCYGLSVRPVRKVTQ